jgi:hypothetical protein
LTIDEYRRQLTEAGFGDVLVVDSRSNLNAYAMVEGQSGCCPPSTSGSSNGFGCCGSASAAKEQTVHDGLSGLLDRYDVNDYAASVKVYAIKPHRS